MVKKVVKNKPNIKIKESTNNGYSVFDEFYDIFTLRMRPISEEYIIQIGVECFRWATTDPEALKITQFFRSKGISTSTFQRWMERSPKFKELYLESKYAIGDRRETGEITRKYSSTFCNPKAMAIYDPEWDKWSKSLEDPKDIKQPINIYLPDIKRTDEVPERS